MGVVYEALDAQGRRIALKTLKSTDPEQLYRLKREFRSLARITHPNLVQFHELSGDDAGWYLAMEFVPGVDFTTYCWRGRTLSPELDIARLRGACAGLVAGVQALHEHGVLHRDLKPSNVIVTGAGRVVIVDFGLACALRPLDTSPALKSEVAGTAAYMAPEQVEATSALGPAVDWYAVGVMLFEVLTGRRPFEGPTFAVLERKLREEAPSLSKVAPHAPQDLAALCDRLLSRDPSQRAGALEISERLQVAPPVSVPAPSGARPALEGRERELDLLRSEWQATLAGSCRVVLVRGESGMGKTALLREFTALARHACKETLVLGGRCYPREAIPYRAMDEVMDQLGAFWKAQPPARATYLMPREPEFLLRAFPTLARVTELEDGAVRRATVNRRDAAYRSLVACREVFQRLVRQRPVVIVLDDVQWIDVDSARLLHFMCSSDEAPALLLVLCARPRAPEDRGQDAVGRLAALGLGIELGPLGDAEMNAVIGRLLSPTVPSGMVAALTREAAGNPFLGVRLAQCARTDPTAARLGFASAQSSQLAGLSSITRSVLSLLSVAGSPLSAGVVASALGAELDGVYRALGELESANLIGCAEPLRQSQFEPYHDRIRQAVLALLDPEQRRAHHRALALEYEAHAAREPERCARHFAAAGDMRQAAIHARRAAELASAQLSFERAAEYYRMCLSLGVSAREERLLRQKLADVLSQAGYGLAAAEQYMAGASSESTIVTLHCEQRAAEELLRAGYLERGLGVLRSALARAGLHYPASATRALVLASLGSMLRRRLEALFPRLKRASTPELLVRVDLCATVSNCLAFVSPVYTRYYQTLHVRLAEQAGDAARSCRALGAEAVYGALGGRVTRSASRAIRRAQRLASAAGDDRTLGTLGHHQGMLAYYQGNWQEALERSVAAERRLSRAASGSQWEVDNARLYIACALQIQGRIASLSRRRERWLEQAEAQRNMFALTILKAGPARLVRLARDEPGELRADLDSVMPLWPEAELSIPRFWELEALTDVDLYNRCGQAALARFHALGDSRQKPIGLRVQVTRVKLRHAYGRAALAAALDRPAAAGMLLATASAQSELLEREGVAWAHALATMLRAGVESAWARAEPCRELLAFAERQLADAGMALDTWVVRYWQGRLQAGVAGGERCARCKDWFERQGVRNVPALVEMRAPGATRY
jgi:eukaryotic-like serine/threonine-protein kinase